MTTDAQLPPPYDTTEVDGLLAWFKEPGFNHVKPPHKWVLQVEQEMRRMRAAIAAHCAQREGEAVAWLWEYIGKDPMRDQYKPCARALHEMDPKAPPYPDSWKPVAPLYTHPSAPPTEEAEQAAMYRWLRKKMCFTGNGDSTASMHALNLPRSMRWPEVGHVELAVDVAIRSAMQSKEVKP